MKKILLVGILVAVSTLSFAQEGKKKPDCKKPKESCSIKDKKACSPDETKMSEAKALTDLRQELAQVSISLGHSEEIEKGRDDEESLSILLLRTNMLLKERGLTELVPTESKAQTVASINDKIAELRKYVK